MRRMHRVIYTALLLFLASSFLLCGVPLALKGRLNEQLYRPIDVAVSQKGSIAVADIHRKHIYIYDLEHKLISTIPLSESPMCVVFNKAGDIYVGLKTDVIVVNERGNVIDKLSQHGLSFQMVVDLAIDDVGMIYIVDREAHRIKMVSSSGDMQASFGAFGAELGQFRYPSGIAINRNTGEIVVADAGNSRVQIFSADRQNITTFGEHIKQVDGVWQYVGKFARMNGISVDNEGRIYVSDSGLDNLQIFDGTGNHLGFLGGVSDRTGRLRVPAGIAISSNGKLFVTSTTGSEVKEYSIESTTEVNPTQPEKPQKFSLEQNYPNPFNPSTRISFSLPEQGYVTLKIYDILGKEIATLIDRDYKSGSYTINWNGKDNSETDVSSGIYFYHLQVGEKFSQTNKMVFLR